MKKGWRAHRHWSSVTFISNIIIHYYYIKYTIFFASCVPYPIYVHTLHYSYLYTLIHWSLLYIDRYYFNCTTTVTGVGEINLPISINCNLIQVELTFHLANIIILQFEYLQLFAIFNMFYYALHDHCVVIFKY